MRKGGVGEKGGGGEVKEREREAGERSWKEKLEREAGERNWREKLEKENRGVRRARWKSKEVKREGK